MNVNNAYRVYRSLVDTYTPSKRYHRMGEAVDEAAHVYLQKGESMCKCVLKKRSIRALSKTSLGCTTVRMAASWDQIIKAMSLDTAVTRSVPYMCSWIVCSNSKRQTVGIPTNPLVSAPIKAALTFVVLRKEKKAVRHLHEVWGVLGDCTNKHILLQEQKRRQNCQLPSLLLREVWELRG